MLKMSTTLNRINPRESTRTHWHILPTTLLQRGVKFPELKALKIIKNATHLIGIRRLTVRFRFRPLISWFGPVVRFEKDARNCLTFWNFEYLNIER